MTFNKQSQRRIANVVRQVERTPYNEGAGKRQRRQQAGTTSRLVQIHKGIDGEDFPSYLEHIDLNDSEQFVFQCRQVTELTSSGNLSDAVDDEEKWINVRNLAREWIPQETIVVAHRVAGEWCCYWRRQIMPNVIFVKGEVNSPTGYQLSVGIDVDVCSLGIIQKLIDDGESLEVSADNYHGWYLTGNTNACAIGHLNSTNTQYYDDFTNFYDGGQYGLMDSIIGNYSFTCVSMGCGGA